MERVLKAEEARDQLILAIQNMATAQELKDFWTKTIEVLNTEVFNQEQRLKLVKP